ncbi:diaminopimelate epimerase [Carboxylicivirga mesophila]|uniref:Diaminopimelate epimerase n=1 Tax=Carboxylicivirga mesophila TaxID=1166478 RepID=A0ABS5KBL7_9BACT|nr:diaminopimelate epimerase [Carboxylicivirga mesophila]MBS2212428.1 diaminopimelate epimerase [Carboxylicivirga mesophila]
MKNIHFHKYQGAGNDFIIIDNRKGTFDGNDTTLIEHLCNRRFGIGGDGLMLLENHPIHDFTMRYFNSDGGEASMCGNGGRCIAAFAVHKGVVSNPDKFSFMAVDGEHLAQYKSGIVNLKMIDVNSVNEEDKFTFLNTGSPHHVCFVDDVTKTDVYNEGKNIRYSERYQPDGTNVNFVQFKTGNKIKVRTYERGVEDETLACGTGVVASAISAHLKKPSFSEFDIEVMGGKLKVCFEPDSEGGFKNVWLEGPATFVFEGTIEI